MPRPKVEEYREAEGFHVPKAHFLMKLFLKVSVVKPLSLKENNGFRGWDLRRDWRKFDRNSLDLAFHEFHKGTFIK